MRVHNLISNIEKSFEYCELKKLESVNTEAEYEAKRYAINYNLYPTDKRGYFKSRYQYLYDNFERKLEYENKVSFSYGVWGDVTATLVVRYSRYEKRVYTAVSYYFHDLRGTPKAIWEKNSFVLPLNMNFNKPLPTAKKILQKVLIESGYLAELQLRKNIKLDEVKTYYQKLMNYQRPVKISGNDFYKSVKKRFNIDSYLSIDETIKAVNKLGKRDTLTKLQKYNSSWIFDFDGDIDELESEFYDTQEQDTIYI